MSSRGKYVNERTRTGDNAHDIMMQLTDEHTFEFVPLTFYIF